MNSSDNSLINHGHVGRNYMSWRLRQLSSSKLLGKSGDHSETKLNYANTLMPDNSSAGSFYRVVMKPVKIINVLNHDSMYVQISNLYI